MGHRRPGRRCTGWPGFHAPAAAAPDVVELGAWKGRSTAWLGFALKDRAAGGRVWAVDTWMGSPGEPMHRDLLGTYEPGQLRREFCANMERLGLGEHVSPVESDTVAALAAPQRPAIPAVKQAGWTRNEIDAFVLARLEERGLTPSHEADRPTLIRRLSLDLCASSPCLSALSLTRRTSVSHARQHRR